MQHAHTCCALLHDLVMPSCCSAEKGKTRNPPSQQEGERAQMGAAVRGQGVGQNCEGSRSSNGNYRGGANVRSHYKGIVEGGQGGVGSMGRDRAGLHESGKETRWWEAKWGDQEGNE